VPLDFKNTQKYFITSQYITKLKDPVPN